MSARKPTHLLRGGGFERDARSRVEKEGAVCFRRLSPLTHKEREREDEEETTSSQ